MSGQRDDNDGKPSSSLARGLVALQYLCEKRVLGTSELAQILDLDKSAASRILNTLVSTGHAKRTAGRRFEIVSPQEDRSLLSESIRPHTFPLLERLSHETNESAYLGLLVDGQVLYSDKVVPERELKVDRPVPTFAPLYSTAMGKVFVATRDLKLPETLTRFTDKSVTSLDVYRQQLAQIREKGYAWDDEEFHIGVRCVAAPVRDRFNNVAAVLCMAAPAARFHSTEIDAYGELIKSIASSARS
ncbi:IclR family transcriptional regulator [Brucella gallinifaecis]|uniref:IclR family transcriptional regulator n=1 Tax=Brucella gallinifaecis TaxID=215590 RepID=UPI002361841C|nr:IclR family transcriptional regulator [Brucella gallinifaecis]